MTTALSPATALGPEKGAMDDGFNQDLQMQHRMFWIREHAIHQARVLDHRRHGLAMVGRDRLLRIDTASDFALEEYARLEGPNCYFKNKLGGLVQYHFGPLRDLRVLDSPQGAGYPPHAASLCRSSLSRPES